VVTSDGTRERPMCSWGSDCHWDAEGKALCARAVCESSGFPPGDAATFVSASNNPCDSSFGDSNLWYYSMDADSYSEGSTGNEAQITVTCGGSAPEGSGVVPGGIASITMSGHEGEVRIAGGGARGVLEMNFGGQGWNAVCDDYFDNNPAAAIATCMTLGYATGTEYDTTHGSSDFAADNVQCPDGATSLNQCTMQNPYSDNCSDGETVGIDCQGVATIGTAHVSCTGSIDLDSQVSPYSTERRHHRDRTGRKRLGQ
jgi:hypothetical protein